MPGAAVIMIKLFRVRDQPRIYKPTYIKKRESKTSQVGWWRGRLVKVSSRPSI